MAKRVELDEGNWKTAQIYYSKGEGQVKAAQFTGYRDFPRHRHPHIRQDSVSPSAKCESCGRLLNSHAQTIKSSDLVCPGEWVIECRLQGRDSFGQGKILTMSDAQFSDEFKDKPWHKTDTEIVDAIAAMFNHDYPECEPAILWDSVAKLLEDNGRD